MKLTIFALVAILGVALATTADVEQPLPVEYTPENFANGMLDFENLTIFTKFYWVARAALKNLKRLNCTIKEVIIIKATAEDFVSYIEGCGIEAVNSFKKVISLTKAIIATCDKIINLNEKVCNNGNFSDENKSTTWKCFWKLLGQLNTLNKQIKSTLKAIKKLPQVPGEALVCTNAAVNQLTNAFTSFPSNVEKCSKLTSK